MASIRERQRKDNTTAYVVRWRTGGARTAPEQSEKFNDPKRAEVFRDLVDLAGQQWPEGWVRGKGFVEQKAEPDAPADRLWSDWGARYIDRLNGIDERSRHDYHRDMRLHVNGVLVHTREDGTTEPPTVLNISEDDIADWVRAEEKGLPDPDRPGKWLRQPAAPKSIANRHGLLYSIAQAAVEAKPKPLRPDNPFRGTTLPRKDDGTEDEMVFLEEAEWQRLRAELALICDGDSLDLADILIGTGLRWGEATALQYRDVDLRAGTIRIQRAWKRMEDNTMELGPPKTKKARRTLKLNPSLLTLVRRLMVGKKGEDYLLTTAAGNAWRHSNFYLRRWAVAVTRAKEKGFAKSPRIHDIRHTHVSWLIAANIPLPKIQQRLGHESITTTVDRYGHLLVHLDDDVADALEAALATPAPTTLQLAAPAANAG
jgi:integrase